MKCTTPAQALERYGGINLAARRWPNEGQWMVLYEVADDVAASWINSASNAPTKRVYCNRDIVRPLTEALDNLRAANLLRELKTFDGCFLIRSVRGKLGQMSTHAYGLALDINATENSLGAEPTLSDAFVECWTRCDWDWGGRFARKDGMHFSYAWEG